MANNICNKCKRNISGVGSRVCAYCFDFSMYVEMKKLINDHDEKEAKQ